MAKAVLLARSIPIFTLFLRNKQLKLTIAAKRRWLAAVPVLLMAIKPQHLHRVMEAVQELHLNFGSLGKGNDSLEPAMMEQIAAGAWG
jgi:hypothetical protein